MARATTACIHIDALRHNLAQIRRSAPDAKVMAVVKADGYGHGLERVAHALVGADAFGVAALSDAQRLRAAGLSQKIVLLSGFDEAGDLEQLRQLSVDTVVHHESQLELLSQDGGPPISVWLKMDTGMHRLGFPPEHFQRVHAQLKVMPNVADEIVLMSHFASSDELDNPQTPSQIACFDAYRDAMPGPCSLANSSALLGWPSARRQWLRAGGALYGLTVATGKTGADFGLKAAMSLSTRLISIQDVKAGERVGYAGLYQCPEDMKVGVAAIGYGDGYPRNIKPGTPVLLNGRRVAIIGRVSMDLMTLDLRPQPDARVGDPVLLWGEGLPIEEIAEAANTISYELTCSITRRVRFIES
ncbi:MAG: alanine racemase [Arenimonas sp.]|nr:alanine racemase [Arenimonas sp.]MBP7916887.1 alanine racemase [Arenimonas sp.]